MDMKKYKLTIEDGVITWIQDTDKNGDPIVGILNIPKEATDFSVDAWINLGCNAADIRVHKDNPVFASAHNCLLSKDGTKLIKVCEESDIYSLTGLKTIGRDAFNAPGYSWVEIDLQIPEGIETLEYRALAMSADTAKITVPASVTSVALLAFMIHSEQTHIIFEGDPELETGVFGTAAEAEDSDFETYRAMPKILFPKPENITVTCQPDSKVWHYCKKYGIPTTV